MESMQYLDIFLSADLFIFLVWMGMVAYSIIAAIIEDIPFL